MAKKKTKKVTAKKVETESLVDAPDKEAEPAPAPAIKEEATLKVVDGGQARYYTQTEYDKKYGKKAK